MAALPLRSAQLLGSRAAYCLSPSTKNYWRSQANARLQSNVKAKDDDKRLREISVAQNGEVVVLRSIHGGLVV